MHAWLSLYQYIQIYAADCANCDCSPWSKSQKWEGKTKGEKECQCNNTQIKMHGVTVLYPLSKTFIHNCKQGSNFQMGMQEHICMCMCVCVYTHEMVTNYTCMYEQIDQVAEWHHQMSIDPNATSGSGWIVKLTQQLVLVASTVAMKRIELSSL